MRSLALSCVRSVARPLPVLKNTPIQSAITAPTVRHRRLNPAASAWSGISSAPYYFDASRQTTKTLKILLADIKTKCNRLGMRPDAQLLAKTIENLLLSLRPGLHDDAESRAHFFALLRSHLGGLNAPELEDLLRSLKSTRFSCHVTESFIDDDIYLKFGCTSTNTSPHLSDRTMLSTPDFYKLLNDLHQDALLKESAAPEPRRLTPTEGQSARDVLADAALVWQRSAKTLPQVHEVACQLAGALGLPVPPATIVAERLLSRASVVGWQDGQLQIEPMIAAQLRQDTHGTLFAGVMRDMLELLLTKKLFGADTLPQQLTPAQRGHLQEAITQVSEHCVPHGDIGKLSAQARTVLKDAANFGAIQILPSAGAAVGHAWISPSLSLMPDKSARGKNIGTRFMQVGLDLAPHEKTVREWPPRFLKAVENEAMYPADAAWHLPVPASAAQLHLATQAVGGEWLEESKPYRFTGTSPAMEATGCRAVVWQAVKRSLAPDALALFEHYNRGLPEPDSPTELWQRLDGLMQWMQRLAKVQ